MLTHQSLEILKLRAGWYWCDVSAFSTTLFATRWIAGGQLRSQFLASAQFAKHRVLAIDLPLMRPRGKGG